MANRGGARANCGRKSKAEEEKLANKLKPMDGPAIKALSMGIKSGDFQFIKLFMEYRYGKPKEKVDITTDGQKIQSLQVEVIRTINKDASKSSD